MARYTAEFTPQAWINDYAVTVDPQGPTTWDVTDYMLSATPEVFAETMKPDCFASDLLRENSNAPEWVRDWTGPFFITVSEEG